jgi:glyoxylase-like metal-dependent hydrolase (beta-lactamase superfamily II)
VARTLAEVEAVIDVPGTVAVETVVGADWEVPLSGLLNLEHPEAKAAHLEDRSEKIVVAFHAIRHPGRGTFLIDTGAERALRDDRDHAAMGGIAGRAMGIDKLKVRRDTAAWIGAQPIAGVFLTHLHLDHVSGMRDVPNGVPVFLGPGETAERAFVNTIVRHYTDKALEGKGTLQEWQFGADGVVDVFGDRSFFALAAPGHTPGSTAYLARTAKGAVLFTGDACHTTWGWQHGVEPGSFSHDRAGSVVSLAKLRALVSRHPTVEVRVGHQGLQDG